MDIRLLLDGGAAPPAPPGKGIESPPPPGEFENKLQKAKGDDKNPGEVAETEPNAPLQKLDSEEKGTEKEIPVEILVEQAVTIPVQFAIAPAVAELQAAVQPILDGKACTSVETNLTPQKPIQVADSAVKDELFSEVAETPIELDDLVASLISNKPTLSSTKSKPCMPLAPGLGAQDTATTMGIAEQTLPKELTQDLRITDVKATTNPVVIDTEAAKAAATINTAAASIKPTTVAAPAKKDLFTGVESNEDTKAGPAVTLGGQSTSTEKMAGSSASGEFDSETPSDSKDKEEFSGSLSGVHASKEGVNQVDSKPIDKNNPIGTADRQRIVDTLTKRIEELSVKSVRNEVRVEMQPAELGSVIVNVRKGIEGLTATLSASNEPLRQALHETRNDLAGALADRNVGQVKIEVRSASADTMNMGQQFNQAQSQHQNQQQYQHRHAVVHNPAANRESAIANSSEQKAAPRRVSTSALDLEI